MNKSHFRKGMNDLAQTLDTVTPSKSSREEAIKKAKAQIIELFMDETTKFNTHADVDKGFTYLFQLVKNKQANSKGHDADLSMKWEEIGDELSAMQKAYNNPDTATSNDEMKKAMAELHHRIKDMEAQQTITTAKQTAPQQTAPQTTTKKPAVKPIETAEIIASLEKLIKETEQEIKNPAQNEYFKKHAKTLQGKNIWIDGQEYTVSHLNKNGTLELKQKDQPKKISLSSFAELKKLGQVNGFADSNQEKDKQNGGLKAMKGLKKHEKENHKFLQSLFAGEKAYLDELTQRVQQQKLQVKLLKENEKTQGNNLPTVIPANGENLPAVVPNKTPDSAEDPDDENSENLPAVTSPKILLKRPKKMIRTNYPAPDTAETPDTENLPAVIPANGENLPAVIPATGEHLPAVIPANGENLPAVIPATGEHLPAVIPANGENLPAIIEDTDRKEKAESGVPGLTETTETTSKELLDLFTLDAHVMDKHKLIKEAERNRIREESDRAYESANRLKKMKMFIRDRYQQHRKLKSSLKTAQEEHNFIEQGDVQQRIDGNIGTYASQDKMNIESRTVEKVDLGSDDKINSIAHQYLMGEISKEEAIAQFNATFKTIYENNTNDIQSLGSMTGTDIMAQLENPETKRDYIITHVIANTVTGLSDTLEETTLTAIKNQLRTLHHEEVSDKEILAQFEQLKVNALKAKLSTLKDANLQIKVKLRGLMKDSDSAEVEGVNYKHLDKGMIALFSKFTNQFGLAGNITAKIITGAIITASRGTPLYALAGVTAVGAGLQWLKTYRDTMRETIKTHEDAINMGMDQIDTLISELEEKNKNASKRAKVGSAFGWNGLHRRNKQLQILQTLKSLKEENALVSVQSLIDGLEKETEKENMIADTLARIDAGHACKTNFISTTDSTGKGLGREQTAIKRKELMDKLQQSAIATPLTVTDDHGTTTTIQVTANSTPEEWSRYRSAIQANETYKHTHDYLINRYDALTHDIKSNRNKQSRSAAGKYTLNAAGAALATGVVSTGRDAINNGLWEDSIQTTQSQTTQSATEFANFKLSKHDMNMIISSGNNYSGLTDGAMIDTAHIDVGVDAVASRAGSFGDYMSKINAVQSMVDNAGLNATTTTALKNALSQDTLNSVMEAGKQAGADLGNQKLLTLRWAEAIEQLTTHLSEYGLNNVTINNVGYTDLVNDLAIQKSVIGASENLVHRGFDVLLTGTNTITNDEIVTSFRVPNREWSPWAGGLGFINTYATPSTKADTLEKKDDNKQQQPDTMKGQQDALDAPKAVVVPQGNKIHKDGSSAEKATTATPVITPQPAEKEKHEMEPDNTFFKSLKEQLSKTKTLTADTIKKLKEELKGIYESDKSKEYRTTMKKKILGLFAKSPKEQKIIDEAPIKELPPVDTTLITEEPKEPTQKKIFEELKNWLTKVKIDIEGKKLALFNGYKARLGKLFEKYKLKNALHAHIAIAQQQIEQNNNTIDTILTKDTITDEDLHQFEQALRSNQAQYTNIEQAEKGKFTILTEKDFSIRNSVQSTYDHMKQLKNDYNTLEEMLAKEQSKSKPNQNMIDLLEIQHEAKKIELEIAYQGAIILIEQSPATTEANTAEQVQQVA